MAVGLFKYVWPFGTTAWHQRVKVSTTRFVIIKENNCHVVKKFVFEIPHSEFDNNFLINCFLWFGWHNWERDKGGTNQKISPFQSPDMAQFKSFR